MSDISHEEEGTGPIKTPKQLLVTVFFSFVAPVFIIIGLVFFVTSGNKPAAGAVNLEKSLAQRIQKVGMVEIRDANRELKSGEEVFKAQCTTCHTAGLVGAPKFGAARIGYVYNGTCYFEIVIISAALWRHGALAGQRRMP